MKKHSTRIAVLISAACILTVAAVAVAHFKGMEKNYVIQVNGSPVFAEEFQMLQKEHAIPHETRLREAHGIPPERTVPEYLGDEEYRRLMCEENIKMITSLRVEQAMAQEYGLTPEFTYERFLADLEAENQSRAEKIANGEVVYGLQRFSAEQFYSYLMSNLRTDLIRTLPEELLAVSDADVDAYYKELKTYVGVDGESIHYTLYDVTAAQLLPTEVQNQLYNGIAATLEAGTYLSVVADSVTYPPEKRAFAPNEFRDFIRQDFNAEFLLSMSVGEVCGPFSLGNSIYLAQYNGFEKANILQDNDRAGFENTLRKEAYENLIAQRTAQADVKVNPKIMIEEEER